MSRNPDDLAEAVRDDGRRVGPPLRALATNKGFLHDTPQPSPGLVAEETAPLAMLLRDDCRLGRCPFVTPPAQDSQGRRPATVTRSADAQSPLPARPLSLAPLAPLGRRSTSAPTCPRDPKGRRAQACRSRNSIREIHRPDSHPWLRSSFAQAPEGVRGHRPSCLSAFLVASSPWSAAALYSRTAHPIKARSVDDGRIGVKSSAARQSSAGPGWGATIREN